VATVVGVSGCDIRVRSSFGELQTRRAASCLLEPALGDLVLVLHHERGSHVLLVLERDDGAPARLSAQGDLEIAAASGKVSVCGRDGVNVVTPAEAVIAAGSARVSAQRGEVVIGALTYAGDLVSAHIDRIKTVAQSMETIAGRWVQRLERAYRFIAHSEALRAEYVDVEARAAFHVKAETALVHSAGLTKIDGSHIHLG
jgi:hypothetical protein